MTAEMVKKNRGKLRVLHLLAWYPSEKNPVVGVFVREHVKATALYNKEIGKGICGLYEASTILNSSTALALHAIEVLRRKANGQR